MCRQRIIDSGSPAECLLHVSLDTPACRPETLYQHALKLYVRGGDRIAKHTCTCAEAEAAASWSGSHNGGSAGWSTSTGSESSSHNGGSAGWSTSTGFESSSGYEDTRMPQRSTSAARPAAGTGSQGSAAPATATNGSRSHSRRAMPHAAEPASAVDPTHMATSGSALGTRAGVSAATLSQQSAPAASTAAGREAKAAAAPTAKHEAEQAAQRQEVTRQRQSQPWERELHAPKPYKPAVIRRGRRRGRRSLGLTRQPSAKPAT